MDPATENWDYDDEDDGTKTEKIEPQTAIKKPAKDSEEDNFGFEMVNELFDEEPVQKRQAAGRVTNDKDDMRQGLKLSQAGQLRQLIGADKEEEKPEKMKIPLLQRIPLINDIDWKMIVPDRLRTLKNIEKAVDNQLHNIVVDAINEFNSLKKNQYLDVVSINKQLRSKEDMSDSTRKSLVTKTRAAVDDDLNILDELEDYEVDGSRSVRNS